MRYLGMYRALAICVSGMMMLMSATLVEAAKKPGSGSYSVTILSPYAVLAEWESYDTETSYGGFNTVDTCEAYASSGETVSTHGSLALVAGMASVTMSTGFYGPVWNSNVAEPYSVWVTYWWVLDWQVSIGSSYGSIGGASAYVKIVGNVQDQNDMWASQNNVEYEVWQGDIGDGLSWPFSGSGYFSISVPLKIYPGAYYTFWTCVETNTYADVVAGETTSAVNVDGDLFSISIHL